MISHLAILPAARSDLLFQAEYYDANGGTQLGDRFLAKCEAAFDRLIAFPESGTSVRYQHSRLAGCRFVLVPSFEAILIFYRPSPDQIEIVRVIHSARDLETALVDKDGIVSFFPSFRALGAVGSQQSMSRCPRAC